MQKIKLIRKKSQAQEKRTAKDFSGKVQIASGAIASMKGDVRTGSRSSKFNDKDFLIENKTTQGKNYVLKLAIWNKIEKEATREGLRIPLLQVDLEDGAKRCAIMKRADMEHLMGKDNLLPIAGHSSEVSTTVNASFFTVRPAGAYPVYQIAFKGNRMSPKGVVLYVIDYDIFKGVCL